MADKATTPSERGEAGLGLRERARRERFERIRQAAETLLQERPFDEITTRDVAQAAAVGEATLFRYISSKDDLLLMVIGRRVEDLVGQIEQDRRYRFFISTETGTQHVERVYDIYRRRGDLYVADPENVANYLRVGLKPGSELGSMSTAHGDRIIAVVRSIIDHGQQAGLLSSAVPADLVAENCNGLYIHEILRSPSRGYPADTFHDRVTRRLSGQLTPLLTL